MDSGSATYYYHRDGIGSIVNLTAASGATEWSYGYEPFGAPKNTTQNDTNAPANELRFAGEYLDTSSGLTNLRARQYDTTSGRFLSTDPLPASASDPSSSTYVYGNNNPLAFIDPSGMGAVWSNDSESAEAACLACAGGLVCAGTIEIPVVDVTTCGTAAALATAVAPCYFFCNAHHQRPDINLSRRPDDLPAQGPPNSTGVVDRGNGDGTIRDYGPDGKARTDYDFGHDHSGAGDPHAHDWNWNGPGKARRGEPRPIPYGE